MKRYARYPWRVWLRQGSFVAVRGIDFTCDAKQFVNQIRQRLVGTDLRADATINGPRVEVVIESRNVGPEDSDSLLFASA